MSNILTMIALDDWHVLYGPDGESLRAGHSITDEDMFRALQGVEAHPKDLTLDWEYIDDEQTLDDLFDGTWPNTLQDLRDYQNKKKDYM